VFTVEPPINSQNDWVYAPVDNKKRYIDPAVCYACRLWCPLTCHKWVWLNWYLSMSTLGWRWTASITAMSWQLSQQMLPAIIRVAERCLFTKQYVAYGEIGHFLSSVISQGKVVALDRWGGKWNHLWM